MLREVPHTAPQGKRRPAFLCGYWCIAKEVRFDAGVHPIGGTVPMKIFRKTDRYVKGCRKFMNIKKKYQPDDFGRRACRKPCLLRGVLR